MTKQDIYGLLDKHLGHPGPGLYAIFEYPNDTERFQINLQHPEFGLQNLDVSAQVKTLTSAWDGEIRPWLAALGY
jgi:hypothetical protein